MANWNSVTRLAVLLLALLLLPGCSAVRVVYNQADNLLAWMAQDYFYFEPLQKQEFNTRLDALLAWHRADQLPDYARFLGEIKQRTERAATREDALWLIEGVKARYRVLAGRGSSDAVEILAGLTPDNIKVAQKQFEKVNKKFSDEHKLGGTQDDRRRARLERTLKRIREWTGPLTPAQEARITALNDTIPYTDQLRQQDRQRRQKEFLALLEQRSNKAEFARVLRPWLADWETGRPAVLQAALEEGYEKRIALYLDVERSLTPQQRAHMQRKLAGYIEDIGALTAKRVAAN